MSYSLQDKKTYMKPSGSKGRQKCIYLYLKCSLKDYNTAIKENPQIETKFTTMKFWKAFRNNVGKEMEQLNFRSKLNWSYFKKCIFSQTQSEFISFVFTGSFPDQGWQLCPCSGVRIPNHWTAGEVSKASLFGNKTKQTTQIFGIFENAKSSNITKTTLSRMKHSIK